MISLIKNIFSDVEVIEEKFLDVNVLQTYIKSYAIVDRKVYFNDIIDNDNEHIFILKNIKMTDYFCKINDLMLEFHLCFTTNGIIYNNNKN